MSPARAESSTDEGEIVKALVTSGNKAVIVPRNKKRTQPIAISSGPQGLNSSTTPELGEPSGAGSYQPETMSPDTPDDPTENDPFIDEKSDNDDDSTPTEEQVTLLNPPNLDPAPPTPTSGSPLVHGVPWGHSHSGSTPSIPLITQQSTEDLSQSGAEPHRSASVSSNKKYIR